MIEVVELEKQPSQYAVVRYNGSFKLADGRLMELDTKPGDIVLLGKYSGVPVTINDEELHFVDYADVQAVISKC